MKKNLVTILLVIVLSSIFTLIVFAEDFQWSDDYRKITQVYPDTDFHFYLDGATIDCNSSCTNRFVIKSTDPNYYIKVGTLLKVFAEGGSIKVNYDRDNCYCKTSVETFKAVMPE
jgi:hypothetical protein